MAGQRARRITKRWGVTGVVVLVAVGTVLSVATGPAGATNSNAGVRASGSATGELAGTITITDAPSDFSGIVGVGACPASTPKGRVCSTPQYTLSSNGGTYDLYLTPGRWIVTGFYELAPFGGEFIGKEKTVAITAGTTVTRNFTVPYTAPGTVHGSISVRGLPRGLALTGHSLLACPSYFHYGGGAPSIVCVQASILPPTVSSYSIRTLPPGRWLLYAGYSTIYGPYTSTVGVPVKVTSGGSAKADLAVAYHRPADGLLTGTVTVTGAPKGFGGYVGVGGCPAKSPAGKICSLPQYSLASQNGGSYELTLRGGSWRLAAFYELAPYGGQFLASPVTARIRAGETISRSFKLRYIPPAIVIGKVVLTKVPSRTVVEETLALACPSEFPYTGAVVPQDCVLTSTPLGSDYSITTLPPGRWILYPGYLTNELEYLSDHGVRRTLTSNRVSIQNLTVAYQS
jgi:hypothetical protein